jgi:hypothetical protein
VKWLRRHRYLEERAAEERSNEPAEPSALEGCAQLALAGGAFLARPFDPKENRDADLHRKERRFSAATDGFDVHCAVRIEASDDQGRERLVRYCTRPPFALDRLTVLRDGRIAYELSAPRKGSSHRVMTPMEFMARLATFVPHPKIPFVRYHGVFSSRSSWRKLVTPKPPAGARAPKPKTHGASPSAPASPSGSTHAPASPAPAPASPAPPAPPASASPAPASPVLASPVLAPSPALALANAPAPPEVTVDPTLITVAHWGRLENGELFAWSRRLDWALMMKRTFGFDVLVCPRCSGKMRVIATITEPPVVRQILEHLGVRASPLPRAPARAPDWEQVDLGFDDAA